MKEAQSSIVHAAKRDSTGLNCIAPFQERLVSDGGKLIASAKQQLAGSSNSSGGIIAGLATISVPPSKKSLQQAQQQQHLLSAALTYASSTRSKQSFRPISAVRAVAKVVAAEAAVSAAAAALVPSKPTSSTNIAPHNTRAVAAPRLQHHKQQQAPRPCDEAAAGHIADDGTAGSHLQPVDALNLHVLGSRAGPHRGRQSFPGTSHKVHPELAAGMASSVGSSMAHLEVPTSLPGGPAQTPAQLSTARHLLQAQSLLQTLSVSGSAAGGQQVSAAAQLAASGVSKRLRAQLRSAHGPPPFQRSAPLPRPASPPPVVLTAEMLAGHSMDTHHHSVNLAMADLSLCNISSISLLASADEEAAPAEDTVLCCTTTPAALDLQEQQMLAQCLDSLVALDLSGNRLECFAALAVLPNLQQLSLSANRLRSLKGLQHPLPNLQHSGLSTDCNSGSIGGGADTRSEGANTAHRSPMDSCEFNASPQIKQLTTRCSSVCSSVPDVLQDPEVAVMEHHRSQQQTECSTKDHHDVASCDLDNQAQGPGAGCSDCLTGSATAAAMSLIMQPCPPQCAFHALEVLDISFNMLSGEVLLGRASPLGLLPRLSELHASGNMVQILPTQLGPFTSLTHLNLQQNQLQLTALAAVSQLPALRQLNVSHNPLGGSHVECTAGFAALQVLDVSSSRVKQLQPIKELLGCMLQLQELRMIHTPLAERCRAGKVQEKDLAQPGITVVLSSSSSSSARGPSRRNRQQAAAGRVPVVKVAEVTSSSKVLAAASRAALVALPHEQLVAAFDRVTAGIDSWQQLAPVLEEEGSWQGQGDGGGNICTAIGWQQPQPTSHEDPGAAAAGDDGMEDRTFLTGVGITGELPEEGAGRDVASRHHHSNDQASCWQDPTERLAVALGLQVSQLAHMTGCTPGNPDAALHRLRHALTHPLVDPDAGQRPQQHHLRLTAATAAKQQPGRVVPLPQPISPALSTRVEVVQDLGSQLAAMRSRLTAMQGTLLPQLAAQATKMTSGVVAGTTTATGGCVSHA